ncbi:MAG: hypothetical protein F6K00_17325 [Leptolyngbya sp. SIOISBB]|nr:hypothetical protein [Leptolyngbya sp. SIOISBB]
MSSSKALLTLGTLAMSLGVSSAAKASSDLALTFELPPSPQAKAAAAEVAAASAPAAPVAQPQTLVDADAPLPIPQGAENPPMAGDHARPAGVYGGLDAIAIGSVNSVQSLLPSPPPVPDYLQAVVTEIAPAPPPETSELVVTDISADKNYESIALFIGIPEKVLAPEVEMVAEVSPTVEVTTFEYSFDNFYSLFEGGTDSLVARAVGSAEGTRTPEGHRNPAYYGHTDPGNGVWNLGTFSYQHGAASPEEADDKQLRRLQTQTEKLRQIALHQGLQLSQEELLNGIDLANQAPLAALDRGGYIDWLKESRTLGMQGAEAIVWARTRSFIDPDTQRWNAPGLGNNVYSISHDQERRAKAIARAIAAFNAQTQIAIAPAAIPNPESIMLDVIAAPTPAEQLPDSYALTFADFTTSDVDDDVAQTIAQTPEPVTDDGLETPSRTADDEPELTTLSLPKPVGTAHLIEAFGQGQSHPADVTQNPQKSGLRRLGQTLTRLLTSSEPMSSTAAAVSEASMEPVVALARESAQELPSSVASTPVTISTPVPALETPSDRVFAEPRVLPPRTVELEGDNGAEILPQLAKQLASDTASQSIDSAASQTDEVVDAIAQRENLEQEAQVSAGDQTNAEAVVVSSLASLEAGGATGRGIAAPTSLTFAPTNAPLSEPTIQSPDNLHSFSANQQTKAPVNKTDAEVIKQQTLDSLDQLQQLLRAEED